MLNQISQSSSAPVTMHVMYALLRANFRDIRALALTFFTPLLMLIMFLLKDPTGSSQYIGMVTVLTMLFTPQSMMQRLTNWREQLIFQRMAATPTPLGAIIAGIGAAQLVMGSGQTMLMLLLGIILTRVVISPAGILITILLSVLGTAFFCAFATLIASLSRRPETQQVIYVFVLLPMFFAGTLLNDVPVLGELGKYVPTALLNSLLNTILAPNLVTVEATSALLALVVLTAMCLAIGLWKFRWEP